jgi:putative membrane protein
VFRAINKEGFLIPIAKLLLNNEYSLLTLLRCKRKANKEVNMIKVYHIIRVHLLLIITLLFPAVVYGQPRRHMYETDYGWHFMGYGVGMYILWIILFIIIGLSVYFIVRSLKYDGNGRGVGENYLEILKRRYASGEINKEEYQRLREELRD